MHDLVLKILPSFGSLAAISIIMVSRPMDVEALVDSHLPHPNAAKAMNFHVHLAKSVRPVRRDFHATRAMG
jgi:hypothetical protein